jgi:hypothetical protein
MFYAVRGGLEAPVLSVSNSPPVAGLASGEIETRVRPGGAESPLGKDADANGEAGRGMGLSRMSTPSSEFPVFSEAGSYPGGPSLSSETLIGSVGKGDGPENHCDWLRPCSGEAVVRGREVA